MLAGCYACIFMCNVFYTLTWLVIDYPFVISPGDLSWVGAIVFLITAAIGLTDEWTPEQKKAAQKYRFPALIAPAVCAAFNVVFIAVYPDITVNYILYFIPTAILSYHALRLFLAARRRGIQAAMRRYHFVTLIWIAFQLLHDLFSTLGGDSGYALPATVFVWLMVLAGSGLYPAAGKRVGA
jgi:ABC-type Na+ efflux pump permease subunit